MYLTLLFSLYLNLNCIISLLIGNKEIKTFKRGENNENVRRRSEITCKKKHRKCKETSFTSIKKEKKKIKISILYVYMIEVPEAISIVNSLIRFSIHSTI